MKTTNLKKDLITIYHQTTSTMLQNKGAKWVNLASYGANLIKNGIDYKKLGYDKLRTFIESYNDIFEVYVDKTKQIPVCYIHIGTHKDISPSHKQTITNWAFWGHFDTMLQDLAEKALDEKWDFKNQNKYSILWNYLRNTFEKIYSENKIVYSADKQYAAFNTGLVDILYKPIYVLFRRNTMAERPQEWYRIDFCVSGEERAGKTLTEKFPKLPEAAHYFNNISDLLYDVKQGAPDWDCNHILLERIDRYPYSLLKEYAPEDFEMLRTESLSIDEKTIFFESYRTALRNDKYMYKRFKDRVQQAIDLAVERVRWNYKSAIPMYYTKGREMCLLLPLCFSRGNQADLALVVSRGESGRYQGETIYPLEWAYRCARLVCRPDSDWLIADQIQVDKDNDSNNN